MLQLPYWLSWSNTAPTSKGTCIYFMHSFPLYVEICLCHLTHTCFDSIEGLRLYTSTISETNFVGTDASWIMPASGIRQSTATNFPFGGTQSRRHHGIFYYSKHINAAIGDSINAVRWTLLNSKLTNYCTAIKSLMRLLNLRRSSNWPVIR